MSKTLKGLIKEEFFMKSNLFCYVLILTLTIACSSKPAKNKTDPATAQSTTKVAPPIPTPSIEAKQLANEQQTTFVTEFNFKKGSEELTSESKQKLKELSQKAFNKGKVEMIKVISWADQEYPTVAQKKLSEDQQEIANKRNTNIKDYLENLSAKFNQEPEVQLISMARRPTAFNKLISSEDARIKTSLESSGIPTTASKNKVNPKSSRAIVLIKLEENEEKTKR